MQGYHDLDATVHITHRSPHTITIQAHQDEEVHVVLIVPHTYFNVKNFLGIFKENFNGKEIIRQKKHS